jgi:hypothetical protein
MKVNPVSFFNFCSGHVPLLRQLAEREAEISEAEARRLIRAHLNPEDELPETTWRRLRELQILVSTEPGADFYAMAEPVARLLGGFTPGPGNLECVAGTYTVDEVVRITRVKSGG